MTDIAYVVLSDLHFGAANSVLSHLAAGSPNDVRPVDVTTPSPVLASFVECMRVLVESSNGAPPTLILAGDVLDLALSTDDVAATVFEQFARAAFCGSGGPVFNDKVLYLPGNHDHHLWETAREGQYVTYVKSLSTEDPLAPAWHSTRMNAADDPQPVECQLLEALLRRQANSDISVQVVYPNLALSLGGDRCVVVHHGHFTESVYLLMSQLKDLLFPDQRQAGLAHVWEWEAENFAWIDFFWSMLGRSGDVGEDVGMVYAQLASKVCMHHYVGNLVGALVDHEHAPHWLKHAEKPVLDEVADWLVDRSGMLERAMTDDALSAKVTQGLIQYLAGPVLDQLKTEFTPAPTEVSFVFGHTHKPFESSYSVAGYGADVKVYNTGGWVVDSETPSPVHGASAVLISSQLDVASLRVYHQTTDGQPAPASLAGSDSWRDELQGKLHFDAEPWVSLARNAAAAVTERHQLSAAYQRLP